jgi:dipeptidyl-peptidase 4
MTNRPGLLATVLLLAVTITHGQTATPLTLEQLFRGPAPQFTRPLPSITGWQSDSSYVEERNEGPDSGRTVIVDARTGSTLGTATDGVLPETLQTLLPEGLRLGRWSSANTSMTLLVYSHENDLYLLDARVPECRRLTNNPSAEQNPTLSPDASLIAFTRDNDLYTIDVRSGREQRYTTDGSDVILNGWASWVYWEEIFGRETRNRAFWWAPDGSKLAFFRFDDSRVPRCPFLPSSGSGDTVEFMRYPKAGDPNPEARLAVATVDDGHITWADFDPDRDQYLGTPFWTPDSRSLIAQWMNRGQDTLTLYAVDPSSGRKQELYTEHQSSWVDWLEEITFLKDKSGFLFRSDKSGWAHFSLYDMAGRYVNSLSEGSWAADRIISVDEQKRIVYFTARKEASTRTDFYSVGLDGTNLRRLTFGPYTHSIRLSPGGSFFITTYSNVSTPPRMALVDDSGTLVRELGDSRTPLLDEYRLAPTRIVNIPVGDGFMIPALITMPLDTTPGRRYPVIISTYGGPGSPSVFDSWRLSMGDQGRASIGLMQMTVDHRGSGHYGKAGEALMHRNLGTWEMHDYIEAVKWLRRQPCVDSTKICITGASYGGYVTALALTYGADYFTHGIANLAVTDWHLYDSHYTERYMDSPEENPEGYAASSVMTHAPKYHGMLRIVHGTLDDNVHVQNALRLADTLQILNKHFELMVYPDQRHGVGGGKFNHYRSEMMRFYYTHLLEQPFPEKLFTSPPRMMGSPH